MIFLTIPASYYLNASSGTFSSVPHLYTNVSNITPASFSSNAYTSVFATDNVSVDYVPDKDSGVAVVDLIIGYSYFVLTAITSVLSMFGSVIILLTYLLSLDLRSPGRTLLVWLSIADFLTAVGNLNGIIWYIIKEDLEPKVSDILCNFHASLTIFSSISAFLWTVAIGIHLYISIVKSNTNLANKLVWIFHIICWLVPCK